MCWCIRARVNRGRSFARRVTLVVHAPRPSKRMFGWVPRAGFGYPCGWVVVSLFYSWVGGRPFLVDGGVLALRQARPRSRLRRLAGAQYSAHSSLVLRCCVRVCVLLGRRGVHSLVVSRSSGTPPAIQEDVWPVPQCREYTLQARCTHACSMQHAGAFPGARHASAMQHVR